MPDRDKKSGMSDQGKMGHAKEQHGQQGNVAGGNRSDRERDRGSDRERDQQGRVTDEANRSSGSSERGSNR